MQSNVKCHICMPRFWREIALSAFFRQETASFKACLKTINNNETKDNNKAKTKSYKYNNGEKNFISRWYHLAG